MSQDPRKSGGTHPAPGGLREEFYEFKASQSYVVISSLENKKQEVTVGVLTERERERERES